MFAVRDCSKFGMQFQAGSLISCSQWVVNIRPFGLQENNMKAIRVHQFGGPEVLKYEEISKPVPGPDQVLLRIKAAGVNPVDTYFRAGSNPKIAPPYTPGLDASGVIEEVGSNVTRVQKGARVYTAEATTGAYAEFALCEMSNVYALPERVSFQQGAGVGVPFATAWRALYHRAQARAGETVLVHGASGGVGTAAVQIARAGGFKVIGTASSDGGRKLVLEQGAHHVVNHATPGYEKEIIAFTEGRGVDVILEMLANVNLGRDLPMLAFGGRVIVIGSRGSVEITPRDCMSREADIRAMSLFNAGRADLSSIHAALAAGLEKGWINPVVGTEMPLAQAAEAHIAVMKAGARGKIVLIP
jgi:NADPH2:quinone reductase